MRRDVEVLADLMQRSLTLIQERVYEGEIRIAKLEVQAGDLEALSRTLARHDEERRAIA